MLITWITDFLEGYNNLLEKADPRLEAYPFTKSSLPNLLNCLLYLFIVTYAGPRFMKNRPAYDLRSIIVPYNWFCVVLSTFIFYEFLAAGWGTNYTVFCQECDYSDSPQSLRMVRVCWFFWISKHIEFLDTYFFIARKRFRQVSFLHVFHHTLMAYTWWWGIKYSAGGLGTFHAMINSLVHMVMYSYYGLSAMGPKYQKYLWWKKYLTVFQMTQFVVVFSHMANIIIFHKDCVYPQAFKYIIASYGTMFFILFSNFWIKNYTKKARGVGNGKAHGNGVHANGHALKQD